MTLSPDCAMPHGFPQLVCRPAGPGVVDGKGLVHVIGFSHLEEKGVKARVMFEKPKPTHIHPASQDTCDGSLQHSCCATLVRVSCKFYCRITGACVVRCQCGPPLCSKMSLISPKFPLKDAYPACS